MNIQFCYLHHASVESKNDAQPSDSPEKTTDSKSYVFKLKIKNSHQITKYSCTSNIKRVSAPI